MASDRVTIEEGSLSADLIAQQTFSTVRRGFDPEEVRSFLAKLAAEILALGDRMADLESDLRSAEYRAAHPVIDEETLLGAVGEGTAHILRSAHEAAADIKNRAEENASRILKEAHQKADGLRAEAETVLARRTEEAEAVAARITENAQLEAERLGELARQQAKAIRAQSEAERQALVAGAQATREKILTHLARKRKVAVVQVEQLLAGRERLLESYQVVRETLEEVTTELARAETAARAEADAIRLRPMAIDEPDTGENPVVGAESHGISSIAGRLSNRDIVIRPTGRPPAPISQPTPVVPPEPQVAAEPSQAAPPSQGASPSQPSDAAPAAPPSQRAMPPQPSDAAPAAPPSQRAMPPQPAMPSQPSDAPEKAGGLQGAPSSQALFPPQPAGGSQAAIPSAAPGRLQAAMPTRSPAGAESPDRAAVDRPMTGTADSRLPSPTADGEASQLARPASDAPAPGQSGWTGSIVLPDDSEPAGTAARPAAPPPVSSDRDVAAHPSAPGNGTAPAATASSVESLFARIREDREKAVTHARQVLAEPEPAADPAVAVERPVDDADEAILQQRDEAIAPTELALTKRLKRVLQDDQNDLLDRLRGLRAHPTAAFVLPARSAQTMRFAAASLPLLAEAASAGSVFVASRLGRPQLDGDALGSLDDLAADLANAIVHPLRRRLEEVFAAAAAEDDRVALADSIGAAYREWKTQRIEATGADHVVAAFARGAFAATPAATSSRWLVEDVDGPCPDCDDNVLAGDVPKGEAYPTGQQHPPAHPGCRCLVVPNRG